MNGTIWYPDADDIINHNIMVLSIIKVKKQDKAQVLSTKKILDIIEQCEAFDGDVYDKAAFLLSKLVQEHPFASGNRRTAFIVTKEFVQKNSKKFSIKDDAVEAKVLQGVRERYYSQDELKGWIKNGKIKKFER